MDWMVFPHETLHRIAAGHGRLPAPVRVEDPFTVPENRPEWAWQSAELLLENHFWRLDRQYQAHLQAALTVQRLRRG
ncbi:hypothetical protein GCM10010174_30950 [Kutzneria viridogrisea]|uniref:Uncharacterized protein n=1 Tax=Kutzneria albida DSM 43870 TaxID=1449976 RepID=W5VZ33_9PSEU|nr:hypothetical protein [Kutzneria albida]AHH93561.1 hypothetical protein KALB_184 [Kutzneria albida DSM 43870]